MSESNDALSPIDDAPDAEYTSSDDAARHDVSQPPEHEVEGAVPPGYDWPTHGGYLGCLVGTIAACLVTGFFGADLFSFLYIARRWPFPIFALLTLILFVVLVIGLGQLGWRLGKRFYRYYPQPKPTWGEDDAAEAQIAPARTDARVEGAPQDTAHHSTEEVVADEPVASPAADAENKREALGMEGRQRQDDGGDSGREAPQQTEDAHHEPQRP